jgi:hypothetical protein
MDGQIKELTQFYAAIRNDSRIGISHISVYIAHFQLYNLNHFKNPVEITRVVVMELAKISGLATYHKCIKDLVEFGYIQYQPSHYSRINSLVWLTMTKTNFH